MEFNYHDSQNPRMPSAMSRPLSTVTYMDSNISGQPLQGCEFAPGDFPNNGLAPTVLLPTPVPVNVDEVFRQELEQEQIRREMEKQEIRREIIVGEMALARRQELEDEVRREMASERALGIPMQRPGGVLVPESVSMSFNPTTKWGKNINIFGGSQSHLLPQVDMRMRDRFRSIKDQVVILAKPDANDYGAKRKAVTPPAANDNEQSPCNLQKKPKQDWSCTICQVAATSQKGLNDHFQGKKHKAKLRSIPENSEKGTSSMGEVNKFPNNGKTNGP